MTHLIDYYQLEFVHPVLRNIMKDIENIYGPQVITSIFRIDDPGVHGTLPVRGTDLRCRDTEFGARFCAKVNSLWQYDPSRPEKEVAVAHGEGSNYHIHLQVHSKTIALS